MEDIEQPRRIGGFLLAVALLLAAAATWAAVALASGSGSATSPNSSVPGVTDSGGGPQQIATSGDGDRKCPHHDGDSTAPSSPSTPSTPSTPSDGSSNPTL